MAEVTPYMPRSYDDLKARSLILASGIAEFADKLPPLSEYGIGRPPTVKWIFLPRSIRESPEWEMAKDSYHALFEAAEKDLHGLSVSMTLEDYGYRFCVWEDVRPNVAWVNERLPQMYELAGSSDCYLEGWTFEDNEAWRFGLSKLIDDAGFDKSYTAPGQMS